MLVSSLIYLGFFCFFCTGNKVFFVFFKLTVCFGFFTFYPLTQVQLTDMFDSSSQKVVMRVIEALFASFNCLHDGSVFATMLTHL